jgi:hypothetical protein
MKQYSKSVIFISMLVLSLCILPQLAKAIGNPDDPGGDPDAPIDGGVGLLVAAGVVYGAKKINDERKKKLNKLP